MLVGEAGVERSCRYGRGRGIQKIATGMNPTILGAALALILAMPSGSARAQDTPAKPPSFDEVQATIKRMQERLNRLGSAAAERDQALRFLERQVDQASGEIAGTGKTNEALRGETAVLSDQLQDLSRRRDQLQGEFGERGEALASLEFKVAALSGELSEARDTRTALSGEARGRKGQPRRLQCARGRAHGQAREPGERCSRRRRGIG